MSVKITINAHILLSFAEHQQWFGKYFPSFFFPFKFLFILVGFWLAPVYKILPSAGVVGMYIQVFANRYIFIF